MFTFWSNLKKSRGSLVCWFFKLFTRISGIPFIDFEVNWKKSWKVLEFCFWSSLKESERISCLVFEVIWKKSQGPLLSLVFEVVWKYLGNSLSCFLRNLKESRGLLMSGFWSSLKSFEITWWLVFEVIWKKLRNLSVYYFWSNLLKSRRSIVLF